MNDGIRAAREREWTEAVERSIRYGLIPPSSPKLKPGIRYLDNDAIRGELSAVANSFVGRGQVAGTCQLVVQRFLPAVEARLGCQAWAALGYLSDIELDNKPFWKMDPEKLCLMARTGQGAGGKHEFHAWIVLDSGEAIDSVVFPTLAELFPHKFGRGKQRCNFLSAEGRPYKTTPGLPILEYHPQAIAMLAAP